MSEPCKECGNYDARISSCGNDSHNARMTTDHELLARIYALSTEQYARFAQKALRAVVELIDKYKTDYYLEGLVEEIKQAIEKELG